MSIKSGGCVKVSRLALIFVLNIRCFVVISIFVVILAVFWALFGVNFNIL